MRKVIAIDFDGCITNEPECGKSISMRENCVDAIELLHDLGYVLVLNTCRTSNDLDAAITFLYQNNIMKYFECINENFWERIIFYGNDCRKISADYYIDDRNFGGFPGWTEIMNYFNSIGGIK